MSIFDTKAKLLRIYMPERDTKNGMPLHDWILEKAREKNIAGATVIKGIAGYCIHSPVSLPGCMSLEINRPVIVEIIEQIENIEMFAEFIKDDISLGIMTVSDVDICFMSHRSEES